MSKKLVIFGIGLISLLITLILLVSNYFQPKTNWDHEFGKTNKSPFGLYIFYQELEKITSAKKTVEIKDLNTLAHLNPKTDVIIFINENSKESEFVNDEINKLNSKPFNIFYANVDIQSQAIEAPSIAKINHVELKITQNIYTTSAKFKEEDSKLKTIGTVTINQKEYPNYYVVQNDKMKEYTHVDPILLTNFYLLQKEGYAYSKEVFKPFKGKNVYWVNPDRNYYPSNGNQSVMSYILSQPELKAAWYLLLFTLFLYLIFKSKREQQQIAIVHPEKNLSLEFTNVIASMYYESGKPTDIIKKKIDYFYYSLRKQFNLTTDNIFDEHFIFILAQKGQITEIEAKDFITELHQLYTNPNTTLKDVNRTYHIIENYKNQAHII